MRRLLASHTHACTNRACFLFVELTIVALTVSCAGRQKEIQSSADLKSAQSEVAANFDRSRCDDKGKQVVSLDANGDGKPDVIKLFVITERDGHTVEQLVCKQTDLDFDGKIDLVQYYSPNGEVVMDEYSMTFNGKFNGRTFFQDGKKVRAEKDMDFNGKPDYFEYYEGGKLVRVERDRDGNGKIDEWQYYEGGQLDRIGYDTTGSGRADKWERNSEREPAALTAKENGTAIPAPAAGATDAAAAADAASRGAAKPAPKAKKK